MIKNIKKFILINLILSLGFFLLMVKNGTLTKIIFTSLFTILFLAVSIICFKGMLEKYKIVSENEEEYEIHYGYKKDNAILLSYVFSFLLLSIIYLYWEDIEKNNTSRYVLGSVIGSIYILLYLYFKLYIK